ncbi:hypothetical protein OG978_23225 [Streptomyces sp. NBC_01591]|uniref:hypothetical protein n=1 Tax=Streptomyces sp. NBC_01591 TaxID=2975888 RepID=UPI002DD7B87D|nr:hypothetical protein [Streptomyces sp. NBC_01591]WSD70031.1 hypothetical protein OG978_23225 [Streptomyces sp. NBC_01591]
MWLLLHLTDHRRYARSYNQLVPILDKHTPGGHSKTELVFRHYESGWLRRARSGK